MIRVVLVSQQKRKIYGVMFEYFYEYFTTFNYLLLFSNSTVISPQKMRDFRRKGLPDFGYLKEIIF